MQTAKHIQQAMQKLGKKLADLKQRWRGRKAKPEWVKTMIAIRRKTVVVCHRCHVNIHAGRPIPNPA